MRVRALQILGQLEQKLSLLDLILWHELTNGIVAQVEDAKVLTIRQAIGNINQMLCLQVTCRQLQSHKALVAAYEVAQLLDDTRIVQIHLLNLERVQQ